jgi:sec-independent protein translocase protein TatC
MTRVLLQKKMEAQNQENKDTIWGHISELRKYGIISFLTLIGFSLLANHYRLLIIAFIFKPLGKQTLLFLSPLDPLLFIIHTDLTIGLILSLPVIIWCIIRFTSPSIKGPVLRKFLSVLFFFTLLIVIAAFYTYYIITPLALHFLDSIYVPQTHYDITAQNYLGFFLGEFFISILIFQIPLILILLSIFKIINPLFLKKNRLLLYIIVIMLLSFIAPTPDLLSFLMVTVPALAVLEIGIIISSIAYKRIQNKSASVSHYEQ